MNIFKLENNTIICIITKNDIKERNMKISELAKGTKNTKKLFFEIMKHIEKTYNYKAENIPLFIEAKPIDNEKLLLAIYEKDLEKADKPFPDLITIR